MGLPHPCLDDDTITALLERRLGAAEMKRVDTHLDQCGGCRALVATLADDVSCARLSNIPEVLEETAVDDAEIPQEVAERIGTVLKGKWTLESVLGVGGMAAVYKGRHRIGRVDAIKVVHRELARDAEVCERFEREARAVNRLSHKSAVAIRDVDRTEDGAPFLVMEFLDGESLSVAGSRGIGTERVLGIAAEVLDVLADAHALGVIHRDVKPANVFLGRDGSVKLLDFGLARLRGVGERSHYTQAGQTLGTLAYMPPEQLKGEGLDYRADVYAVGATMFRMLASRHVHVGATSSAEALVQIASDPAPSLAAVAPELPVDVCRVVDRALGFHPDDRYPDAEAMRSDILDLLAGRKPSFALSLAQPKDDPDADARKLVGQTVGGYVLESLIARGGMGGVYAGKRDGERVAVKVILGDVLERGGDARARFRREIRAASRIESPHVVRVLEAGIDEALGLPFYAMELLEGLDVAAWLAKAAPLAPKVVAQIFLQVCRGIQAAHAAGIVHRDIKPANIMLTPNHAGVLVAKICDFGLAKNTLVGDADKSASLTQSGGILGTPRYAAPEQATRAKEVDERADVWGLCISMHEALSGTKPWSRCETLGQLIVAICTEDIEPVSTVAPWVNRALSDLIRQGLVRDREHRLASLEQIEAQLVQLGGDASLTAADMVPVADRTPVANEADTSEDVTVARSAGETARSVNATVSSVDETPARKRSRGRAGVAAALLAVAGALGWVAWSRGVGEQAGTVDAHTQPLPSAIVADPAVEAASARAASNSPEPAASQQSADDPDQPASVAAAPSSVAAPPTASTRRVPVQPAVPSRKPPSKPGGLDFHKTW